MSNQPSIPAFGAFTVEQFAVWHQISRAQAYDEISAGRLVARKVGSRSIITAEDAATWRKSLPKMTASAVEATAA